MYPQKIFKPARLHPGDTIGVVAPASPFIKEELQQGLGVLHAMGYRTLLADDLFANEGYLAGSDALRAAQLQAMFTDDQVHAVMCARGGYGSVRILPRLDRQGIGPAAKPFIGFSDITSLHHLFFFKLGRLTFHGPTVCSLAKADQQTQAALQQALTSDGSWRLTAEKPCVIQGGRARGVLVGGNLTTLCHLLGTPYAGSYADTILFLEDKGEAPYRIDRMLTQMKLAGCFSGMAAVVLGSFQDCGSEDDIARIAGDVLGDLRIPVAAGFAFGHTHRNITLPIGVLASLDADRGELDILESATAD